jgi:hypothetical protein
MECLGGGIERDETHGVVFVFEKVCCVRAVDNGAFGDELVKGGEEGLWG